MAALFAVTLFAASALLFLVEPMVGKMLLPNFGGAPAVWNTCLAFFQAALLAGYAYAYALTRLRSARRQLVIHLVLLALPWIVLPLAIPAAWGTRGTGAPTLSLIAILATTVALPFFVLASTSPLLQQWLAATRHRHAADPYYLYVASNAGSLCGLLLYPVLIEPRFTLSAQSRLWAAGYGLLMMLTTACVAAVWRHHRSLPEQSLAPTERIDRTAKPSMRARLRWIALAFVPSSLLLGVTAHLSTDVSPVPMIWIVPLALYLLSFMLAFSRLPGWTFRVFAVALPLLILAQIYHLFTAHAGENYSMLRLAGLHLATFFCAAMVCHGELARSRPASVRLTEFYFWLSLGGVLGGLFNALVAPLVFQSLLEYPLAMAAAAMFSPLVFWRWPDGRTWFDGLIAVVVGLAAAVVLFNSWQFESNWPILLCLLLCAACVGRPVCFGLCAAALFIAIGFYDDEVDHVVLRRRGFYGVLQVQTDFDEEFYYLLHGRIRHGQQRRSDDPAVRDVPLIYYFPTGPIGQVFHSPPPAIRSRPPIAVVGLGVGSLAYYGQPGQDFDFYEIDPAVQRLARDDRFFTYLRDSQADCRVLLGDARLSLGDAPDRRYGMIVVDAFSGDAIPVHLLTHEAMQLYLAKLADGGLLAFHISNQFLDLAPVLGNLAHASQLVGLEQNDAGKGLTDEEKAAGKASSHWVIVARRRADLGPLTDDARWSPLLAAPDLPLWTDHYTSIWGIAHWKE
jgi:hypothetical protein